MWPRRLRHTWWVRNNCLGLVELAQGGPHRPEGGLVLAPGLLLPDAREAEVRVRTLREDALLQAPDALCEVFALADTDRAGHVLREVLAALPEVAQGREVTRDLQRVVGGGVLRQEGVRQELAGRGQQQQEAPVQRRRCVAAQVAAAVLAFSSLLCLRVRLPALGGAHGVGRAQGAHRPKHHLPHAEWMPAALGGPAGADGHALDLPRRVVPGGSRLGEAHRSVVHQERLRDVHLLQAAPERHSGRLRELRAHSRYCRNVSRVRLRRQDHLAKVHAERQC
mmetsp:Transcript_106756/g.312065  ORF Transcript_106756/g.312065 Transcript_106756/m.312065 type:complete len:280 (-) Transcript_106756:333-1172(-)